MAPVSTAPKRIRVSSISKKKPITTLEKPNFNANEVKRATKKNTSFKCPVSPKKIFLEPTDGQVRQFYGARNFSGTSYDRLPQAEKLVWRESLRDN
ncbi:unnamed protein product, partial [Ectocarpus sp. 12 AP-2014]